MNKRLDNHSICGLPGGCNISGTAPANAAYLKVQIQNTQANSVGYADDVFLQKINEGTPSLLVTQATDYFPFGASMREVNTSTPERTKFKFQGKERDLETGYDYVEARGYDSRIGRFMQVDPMFELEQLRRWNPYNYSLCQPFRFVDPSGLVPGDPPFGAKKNEDGQPNQTYFEKLQSGDIQLPTNPDEGLEVAEVGSEVIQNGIEVTKTSLDDVSTVATGVQLVSLTLTPITGGTSLVVAGASGAVAEGSELLAIIPATMQGAIKDDYSEVGSRLFNYGVGRLLGGIGDDLESSYARLSSSGRYYSLDRRGALSTVEAHVRISSIQIAAISGSYVINPLVASIIEKLF